MMNTKKMNFPSEKKKPRNRGFFYVATIITFLLYVSPIWAQEDKEPILDTDTQTNKSDNEDAIKQKIDTENSAGATSSESAQISNNDILAESTTLPEETAATQSNDSNSKSSVPKNRNKKVKLSTKISALKNEESKKPSKGISLDNTKTGIARPASKAFYEIPDGMISLSGDLVTVFRTDKTYDFFASQNIFKNIGMSAQVDLFSIKKRWNISVGLAWTHEKVKSKNVFGGLYNTFWTAESGTVSAKIRYRLTNWTSPHLRVFGGATYSHAQWRDLQNHKSYFKTWKPSGTGGIGLGTTFHTPGWKILTKTRRFPILSAGILIEAGVMLGNEIELKSTSEPSGAHPIGITDVPIGALSRTAPYVRTSIVLRF